MAAFSADIQQLEALYFQYGEELFSLCYLYTARSGDAFALMRLALCDMAYSEKQWKLAASGREGFFRAVHKTCMDFYVKNPRGAKKKKKKGEAAAVPAARAALPFSLTDPLRNILHLPVKFKTALYLRLGKGWTAEQTAAVIGGSPARVEALMAAAMKKLDTTPERAKNILSALGAGEDALQRVWDRFLTDRDEQGFEGKQRLRRFKRALDNAIPYIALGVVALGAVAFFGVEYGWFGSAPYSPTVPIEGYTASGHYGNDPQPASRVELDKGDVSVYVPEEGAFVEYVVHDTPRSPLTVAKQMVALGGLPEGVSVVSTGVAYRGDDGTVSNVSPAVVGDYFSLTVEFSQEALDYFQSAAPADAEAMLRAMTRTYAALYGSLEELSFQSGGEELTADGRSARQFLTQALDVSRTVETDYRE